MGNQNFSERDFVKEGWHIVSKDMDKEVYFNRLTGEEIDGYSYLISDESEFVLEKNAFNLRLNSNVLVASRYFLEEKQRNLCLTSFNGKVFLESTPCRLSKVDQIPFPDILHVYYQCFIGFKELFEFAGYFDVTEDLICINKQGVVKVWLNPSLEKIRPDISYGGLSIESEMVDRSIRIIDKNTNHSTLPISILDQFLKSRLSSFDQALNVLNEISLRTKTTIPRNLKSAEELLRIPSQTTVNQSWHYQAAQPQPAPAYQAASPEPKISLNNKRVQRVSNLPSNVYVTPQPKMTTSKAPQGVFPARVSTSKYSTNVPSVSLNPQKTTSKIRQITQNQAATKGTSIQIQQRSHPAILESPPITSKAINKQVVPTANFLNSKIPIYSNVNQNYAQHQKNINSVHGSQAGSFQFKSHHPQQINFNKHLAIDATIKNTAYKTHSMNNTLVSFEKRNNLPNQFRNHGQVRRAEEPQFVQFRSADFHNPNAFNKQHHPHSNILKHSNDPSAKLRTHSLQNVQNQNYNACVQQNQKLIAPQLKPGFRALHNEPMRQVKPPTIQFHQQINSNINPVHRQIPSASKRAETRTQANQSDRTHHVRFNIDTDLRQSNTPVHLTSKTPTHYQYYKSQAERIKLEREKELQFKQFSSEQKSLEGKHQTNNTKQDGRFSNHKKYENIQITAIPPVKTALRFDNAEQFRPIVNPNKGIQFNNASVASNPYANIDMNRSVQRRSHQFNRYSAEKLNLQNVERVDDEIRHSNKSVNQTLNKSN